MDKKIKSLRKVFNAISTPKIFCIAVQRTGTTSVGEFFRQHGFQVAPFDVSNHNQWTRKWFTGDYDAIFNSKSFKLNQVFEDDPWWCPEFYKVLFHRFPNSKFVLVERESNTWFDSMIRHSKGRTMGNTHIHCSMYNRLGDFYDSGLFKDHSFSQNYNDNLLPLDETNRKHYEAWYEIRNLEVKSFFKQFGSNRIISVKLEENDKWQKIGAFFNFDVEKDFDIHIKRPA